MLKQTPKKKLNCSTYFSPVQVSRHQAGQFFSVFLMQMFSHPALHAQLNPEHSPAQWGLFMLLPLMNFKALFSPPLFYFSQNYCNLVCSHVKHLLALKAIFFSNYFLQKSIKNKA